jgi:hypothetical protein
METSVHSIGKNQKSLHEKVQFPAFSIRLTLISGNYLTSDAFSQTGFGTKPNMAPPSRKNSFNSRALGINTNN